MSDGLPIGTVYTTRDKNFNPNTTKNNLFVGKWEKVSSTGLYPVATTNGSPQIKLTGNGDVTGSNTHTLNNNEIPSHAHKTMLTNNTANSGTVVDIESNWYRNLFSVANTIRSAWNTLLNIGTGGSGRVEVPTTNTGGGAAHNNQPYSFLTNMWIRVS